MASSSSVAAAVREAAADWDDGDDATWAARFKALSGQRADWEPRYLFWRDLILRVARRLGRCILRRSEVKNIWFARAGLTPLCIEQVLNEMRANGDILLREDLIDPTSGRLYQIFRRVGRTIGIPRSWDLQNKYEDHIILRTLLEERSNEVIKILAESHWTSTCVITMEKFQRICKASDEAFPILSYLTQSGKAQYLSIRGKDFIEGVKFSLVAAPVPSISNLDYDVLHLIQTTEILQQQLDVIDRRFESSRKMALAAFKSGNKPAAYKHIRLSKLLSESRAKCTPLLERVEEVIGIIANAESTKKVSEAIRIGAQAIKENRINVEEVRVHLQELEESVDSQREVNEALESMPLQYTDVADEDVEEEFKNLEVELADENRVSQIPESKISQPVPCDVMNDVETQGSTESLSQSLSKLNLASA